MLKTAESGLQACYPKLTNAKNFIISTFLHNLGISCSEPVQERYVSEYDLLSVTMRWSTDNDRHMTCPIVRGSPYTTMNFNNVTPVIGTQHAILSVNTLKTPGNCEGTKHAFSY
jgi:endoglucanase Acf2